MRRHFEQARLLANRAGAAARCEAAAWLALTAARLGARTADADLLDVAEKAADEAAALAASLPGHAVWGAQADAARAEVALARGDAPAAAGAGGAALQALEDSLTEDAHLETLLSASRGVAAGRTTGNPGPGPGLAEARPVAHRPGDARRSGARPLAARTARAGAGRAHWRPRRRRSSARAADAGGRRRVAGRCPAARRHRSSDHAPPDRGPDQPRDGRRARACRRRTSPSAWLASWRDSAPRAGRRQHRWRSGG